MVTSSPGDDWRYVRESACVIHPPEPGKPAAMWLTIDPDAP